MLLHWGTAKSHGVQCCLGLWQKSYGRGPRGFAHGLKGRVVSVTSCTAESWPEVEVALSLSDWGGTLDFTVAFGQQEVRCRMLLARVLHKAQVTFNSSPGLGTSNRYSLLNVLRPP